MSERPLSPQQFADAIGHDRESVMKLIRAGEIVARDERMPGAKIPRYRIDASEVTRWRESRIVQSSRKVAEYVARLPRTPLDGLLARRRQRRQQRLALSRGRD